MLSSMEEIHGENSDTNNNNNRMSRVVIPTTSSPPSTQWRKSMEEVWKDLTLGGLSQDIPTIHHHHHHQPQHGQGTTTTTLMTPSTTTTNGIILQDFLAGNFKDAPTGVDATAPTSSPALSTLPPVRAQPSISLNLNYNTTTCDSPHSANQSSDNNDISSSTDRPLNSPTLEAIFGPPSPADFFTLYAKKRRVDSNGGGDLRQKRMIKNRESAARSRARKQAYTQELEQEVENLIQENEKLRRQQEELRSALASSQVAPKSTLQRTSTAPF